MASTYRRLSAILIDWVVVLFISLIMLNFISTTNSERILEEQNELYEMILLNEISVEDSIDEIIELTYDYDKSSAAANLMNLIIFLGYFGIYQYYQNETIGKKIMGIKLKGNNFSLHKSVLRTCLIYGVFATIINIILVYSLNAQTYFYIAMPINLLQSIFILVSLFMMLFREDKKGLHDIIVKTEIVRK